MALPTLQEWIKDAFVENRHVYFNPSTLIWENKMRLNLRHWLRENISGHCDLEKLDYRYRYCIGFPTEGDATLFYLAFS